MNWQPIETAPKDGTLVDLWCIGDASDIAFYCPQSVRHPDRRRRMGRVADVHWLDGAWRPKSSWRLHGITVEPTHWMLRPEPPHSTTPASTPAALRNTASR